MYSRHNEGKSIVGERLIRNLKGKTYKKMTANDMKSYLGYLIKLVDEFNNTYHRSICKKPINADYFVLFEEIESSLKALKFKVSDRVRITKYKNIFRKGYTKRFPKEIFVIDSVMKTSPWTYKITDFFKKVYDLYIGKIKTAPST